MVKRKDGLWQEQMAIEVHGRKKQKYFYGKTKKEVLQKIRDYTEQEEKGLLFSDVADEWWATHAKTLSYNTIQPYKAALTRALEAFGLAYIKQIKPTDINRFILNFVKEKHAAQKTAKTQLMIINMICKYATANGYIPINPARDISIPKGLEHNKREIASNEDIQRIKANSDATFGMFAYWLLYTGCRRGELLSLTWKDIDVENRTITISKSVYYQKNKPIIKQPKTLAGFRVVPLVDRLLEKITPSTGKIFKNKDGEILTRSQFHNLWNKYTKESGVTCTPHQIRHAYATMLFENDIDIKDAQELLGHAHATTTQDIYTHVRESRKKKLQNKLMSVDIGENM